MNAFTISLKTLLLMTILLGGIYPAIVTITGKILFPIRSGGSLVTSGERVIGSELIAQEFTRDDYFHGRPGGTSQKSATSADLKRSYEERKAKLPDAPADLLWASGSGIDPHISPESARLEAPRVARARKLPESEVLALIPLATEDRSLGFMGQLRVNVLNLNRLLDKKTSR